MDINYRYSHISIQNDNKHPNIRNSSYINTHFLNTISRLFESIQLTNEIRFVIR